LVQYQMLGEGKLFDKSFSFPQAPLISKTLEMGDNTMGLFYPNICYTASLYCEPPL